MSVASDYAIAIATLGDRLKDLAPLFSTDDKQTQLLGNLIGSSHCLLLL